ncbi:MAG TPA: hypothetical protein VGF59_33590, partial [Bryobacteraceae bacterium]
MRPDSDIDLLVEFFPNAEVGLIEHAGVMLELARLPPRDLVARWRRNSDWCVTRPARRPPNRL